MLILKLCFFSLSLFNCLDHPQKTITVIGRAENDKGEAYVYSKTDKKNYYVAGIHFWDQKILGKKIKVTGQLSVREIPPQKEDEEPKQLLVGKKYTILNPKWELAK